MPTTRLACPACGRRFVPDPFNAHHQKCCTHADCVAERKRTRQREWAARKRLDPAWRRQSCERVKACQRRQRARSTDGPAGRTVAGLEHVLVGLAARLTEASSTEQVHEYLRGCEEHGRRLSAQTAPPLFSSINRQSL